MLQLNKRFVDVDFPAHKRYTFGNVIPSPFDEAMRQRCGAMPVYEDAVTPIPSSQWRELADLIDARDLGLEWLVSRIYDQGQEGSCVGNAGAQSGEVLQARENGKDNVVPLSAVSLYQLIGSSANSGATIPDCIEALHETGVIPLDTPENRQRFGGIVMPHRGFRTRRPDGWREVAAQFRTAEWFSIRTFEGLVTAGLMGLPVVVGRQGHSILYLRTFYQDGKLLSLYVNSWRESWGFAAAGFSGGFGADSERTMRQSASWAFAPRVTTTPLWEAA